MLIPADYKNYLIASLDINFWPYFIPGIIHAYFYFSLYFLLGVSITDIKKSIDGEIKTNDPTKYWLFVSVTIMLVIFSMGVLTFLIMFTIKSYKKF